MKRRNRKVRKPRSEDTAKDANAVSIESIAVALKKLRFKKSLFGVNERNVWVKIRKLDEMYRMLYQRQEIEYRALIKERDEMLKKYQEHFNSQHTVQTPSPIKVSTVPNSGQTEQADREQPLKHVLEEDA